MSTQTETAELKYWYLHKHKLFRTLSFSEINALCILKKFKKSKRSETVELPNQGSERVYYLKKGTLKLIRLNEDGDEILVDVIQKGDLFGELGLENDQNNSEFIKVISDEAFICTFERSKLEEIMLAKPDFALSYIKFLGLNMKKMRNSYKNIFFKDAKTRFLLLLDSLAEKEEVENGSFTLHGYITQNDLAQLICTTRQTIINLINELEEENIIANDKKNITILDVQQIKDLVEPIKEKYAS